MPFQRAIEDDNAQDSSRLEVSESDRNLLDELLQSERDADGYMRLIQEAFIDKPGLTIIPIREKVLARVPENKRLLSLIQTLPDKTIELMDGVDDAIRKLPPRHQIVIMLMYYLRRKEAIVVRQREVASLLNPPVDKRRISAMLEEARRALRAYSVHHPLAGIQWLIRD